MTTKKEFCSHCGQKIPPGFYEERAKRKGENVKRALKAAKARGVLIGRPKLRDDALIHRLRKQGLSYRAIAKQTGTSFGSVQASLVEE